MKITQRQIDALKDHATVQFEQGRQVALKMDFSTPEKVEESRVLSREMKSVMQIGDLIHAMLHHLDLEVVEEGQQYAL